MMRFDEQRILSRPVELHWTGWASNTHRLQQAGWSFSVEQCFADYAIQIAMRNERAGLRGISARVPWDYMEHAQGYLHKLPTIPVQIMGNRVEMVHHTGPSSFIPVDAYPQLMEQKRTSLDDFAHFAPAMTRTDQIIVPEDTVDDLMSRILEMQQGPRIERIREEIREGDIPNFGNPKQNFHAQIISLAV